MKRFSAIIGMLAALFFLSGCGIQQYNTNMLSATLRQGQVDEVYGVLAKQQPSSRDQSQHLLNLGLLKFLKADYSGSVADLEEAKKLMDDMQASSVTGNLAALTVNETMRGFVVSPSEFVFLHQLLALNYLALNDVHGARVEMLQADVRMDAYKEDDKTYGQLSSTRYLAGVVYELNREYSDALIAYRKAYQINKMNNVSIPVGLQQALLFTTQAVGKRSEYRRYAKEFGITQYPSRKQANVVVLYYAGVVSVKHTSTLSVYSDTLEHYIGLAVPSYHETYASSPHVSWSVNNQTQHLMLLDNMDVNVRKDLGADMGRITATTLARAVVKHNAARQVQEKNGGSNSLISFIANVAVNLTEVSDTRSWNTLPSEVQVGRAQVDAGMRQIQVAGLVKNVMLKSKRLAVVIGHSLQKDLILVQK